MEMLQNLMEYYTFLFCSKDFGMSMLKQDLGGPVDETWARMTEKDRKDFYDEFGPGGRRADEARDHREAFIEWINDNRE